MGAEEDNAVAAAIASLVTDNPFLKLIPTSIIGQVIAAHTAQTTVPQRWESGPPRTSGRWKDLDDEDIPEVIILEDPPLNEDLPGYKPEHRPIDGPTWMEEEKQKREEEKLEAEAREMWRKSEEQRKKTDRLFPPPAIRQPAIFLDETREQAEKRKERARKIAQQRIVSKPGGRSTGGGKGILAAEEGTTKGKDDETSKDKDKDKDPTSDDKVPIDQRPFARKGQPPEEPPEEPRQIEVTPGDPTLWRDWRATEGDPDAPWNYVSKAMQRLDPSEMGPDGRPVRFTRGHYDSYYDTDLYQVIENMEDKDNPILRGSYDLMQGYVGTFLAGEEGYIEIWTDRDTTMEDLNQADSVEYTATTGKPLEYLETGTIQGQELAQEKYMMDQLDNLRASLAKLDGGLVSNEAKAYIWDIARRRAFDFRNVMDIMRDPAARFSGKFESLQVDPETAKRITDASPYHAVDPDALEGVIPPADPTDMHYMTAQHSPNLLVGQVKAFFREINDLVFRIEKQARISPLRGMSARDLEARLSQNEIADATREAIMEQVPNAQWFRTEIPYTVEFKVDRTRPEFNNPDGSPWSPRPGLGRITEYELQEGSPYGKLAYVTWKDLTREERRDILTAAENGWDLPAHRITWHEVGDYGERQASAISGMDYRQIAMDQAEFNIADYAMHRSQVPPSEFDHVVEFDSKGRPGGLVPQQFQAEYQQWSDQIRENNKSNLKAKNVSEGYSQFVEDKILSNQADKMSEVQLSRIREEMRDRIPDGDNAATENAYGSRTPERDEIQAITQYDQDSLESQMRPYHVSDLSFERYSDFADGARSSTMGSMLEGGKDPEVGEGFRAYQGRHEPPIGDSFSVYSLNDFIRQVRLDPENFEAWVNAQEAGREGTVRGYADYAALSSEEQDEYHEFKALFRESEKDWQTVTHRERPVALQDLSDKDLARRVFDLIEEFQTVTGVDWGVTPMWRQVNNWRVNPRYNESQAKLDWELGLPSAHGVMDQMSDHRVPHLQREITEHLATLAMRVQRMQRGEFPEIYFDPNTWKDVYDAQPSKSPIDRSYGYEPYKKSSVLYEEAVAFEKLQQQGRETIDENLALTTSGDVTLDDLRNNQADVDTVAKWMGEHVAEEGLPMPPEAEKFLREMVDAHARERDTRQKGLPNKPFDPAVRENRDALRLERELFNELVLDRLWSRHGARYRSTSNTSWVNESGQIDVLKRWNNLDDKAKQAISEDYSDEKFKGWYEGQVAVLRRMSNAELSQALRPFDDDQINTVKYHGPEYQWINEAMLDMAYNEANRRLDKILKDVDHWAQDPDWGK